VFTRLVRFTQDLDDWIVAIRLRPQNRDVGTNVMPVLELTGDETARVGALGLLPTQTT